MRRSLLVFCCALLLAGCGDGAQEMFETARFEEQQFNPSHATTLYRQILEKYPDSPYAEKAKARLAELTKE